MGYAKNHLGFMFVGLHGLSGVDAGMGAELISGEEF